MASERAWVQKWVAPRRLRPSAVRSRGTSRLAGPKEVLSRFRFPETALIRTSDPALRRAMYRVFEGRDFYTGQPVAYEDMHIDHVVAVTQGGPDNVFNYVLTTANPNAKKGSKFDAVAAAGVLSYVRLYFAPKVLSEIEKERRVQAQSARPKRVPASRKRAGEPTGWDVVVRNEAIRLFGDANGHYVFLTLIEDRMHPEVEELLRALGEVWPKWPDPASPGPPASNPSGALWTDIEPQDLLAEARHGYWCGAPRSRRARMWFDAPPPNLSGGQCLLDRFGMIEDWERLRGLPFDAGRLGDSGRRLREAVKGVSAVRAGCLTLGTTPFKDGRCKGLLHHDLFYSWQCENVGEDPDWFAVDVCGVLSSVLQQPAAVLEDGLARGRFLVRLPDTCT